MAIVDMLNELLPKILPQDPEKAINGTKLIKLLRQELKEEYEDQYFRNTFTEMSRDPTSPIARKDKGHGYYLRANPETLDADPEALHIESQEGEQPPQGGGAEGTNPVLPENNRPENRRFARATQPEEKFRALFMRYSKFRNRFPVYVEHVQASRRPGGVNKWKFPDLIVLDWEVGEIGDFGYRLNKNLLHVRKGLGEPPFRLTSIELKVSLDLSDFREYFFQCVSNSRWAHQAYLIVANPLQDEVLVNELRRLGTSFDVSISSFGLVDQALSDLPSATDILNWTDEEIEAYEANFSLTDIVTRPPREAIDWQHIADLTNQSVTIKNMFEWISLCLNESKAYQFVGYQQHL